MMKNRFSLLPEKDSKIQIMQDRIALAEKHLGELCSTFAAFSRKLARFRDKHDDLAKCFQNYSEEESVNKTLSMTLERLCTAMTILADYLDIEVHRVELKVVNELAQYGSLCKNARENLRAAVTAREKAVTRQKQLMDIKSKFSANSSAADSELLKAKLEVNRANKEIDEIIGNFERTRLKDTKQLLLDFVTIAIKQHAKAIEVLTATHYDVSSIDETADFQEFKKLVKLKTKAGKTLTHASRSLSMDILGPTRKDSNSQKLEKQHRLSASTKDISEVTEDSKEDDEDESDDQENNAEESNERSLESDEEEEEEEESTEEQDEKSEIEGEDSSDEDDESSLEAAIKSRAKASTFKTFADGLKSDGIAGTSKADVTTKPSASTPQNTSPIIQVKSINCVPRNPTGR